MKIDLTKINSMPFIGGPIYDLGHIPGSVYQSIESLTLQYETDPEAIPPLLPEPYQPGRSPLVTVIFVDNNGVDFMEGGGYRFASISVEAVFESEKGPQEGHYILVMPENNTVPILSGREWLGMPKFYSEISPIRILGDGHLRCETSLWGHLFFGIDIAPPFREQNALVCKVAEAQFNKAPAFGYKYIAALDGPPDVDYPTVMWSETKFSNVWFGKTGGFYLGNPSKQDVGYFKPVVDALRSLPVRKITQTIHAFGSMVLRNDKNGRLR